MSDRDLLHRLRNFVADRAFDPATRDLCDRLEEAAVHFEAKSRALREQAKSCPDHARARRLVLRAGSFDRTAGRIRALAAPAKEATVDRVGVFCESGDHETCRVKFKGIVTHLGGKRAPCSCECHTKGGADGR